MGWDGMGKVESIGLHHCMDGFMIAGCFACIGRHRYKHALRDGFPSGRLY